MQIRKAVITAAARGVRLYPAADTVQKAMLPFVDRDGLNKPVIQIIAEEALESGIEEICVICAPGDEANYYNWFESLRNNLLPAYAGTDWAIEQEGRLNNLLNRLTFAVQSEPLGYGDAVLCARPFAGSEPFLLLLGDHLYISHVQGKRCAEQLIEVAKKEDCAVAAVQATRENLVGHYGTLSGKRYSNDTGLYQIERILEKPSVSKAELELHTAGLRAGHFLCFFGMHVLTPTVFDILDEHFQEAPGRQLPLTSALQELARREKYLALEVSGTRYDIGRKFGLVHSQIALALSGPDRDAMLTLLVEMLAESGRERK